MLLNKVVFVLSALTFTASISAAVQAETLVEQRAKHLLQADPQTILRLRSQVQNFAAARQAPVQGDFEPSINQEVLDLEDLFEISLEPDQPAPKIFLARYQSSAISFVDAYGNPWPIRKVSNFLNGLVLIEKAVSDVSTNATEGSGADLNDPQAGSFTMTALKHGVVGNITVYLHGLSTPISILLVGKPSMYHRVVTLRVSDVGPQTNETELFQSSGVTIGTAADVDLNNALYGVRPTGSEEMVVEGADGKAWLKGEYLYLQTPIAIFIPEIIRSSNGNGKYRAYKLPRTTRAMGTNTEGRTVQIRFLRHPATDINEQNTLRGGM